MTITQKERIGSRLPASPGERIDRRQVVHFTFDGREYGAYAGETVGAALHAAGVHTLSRSFKYHRPRGLFCVHGHCPNCMMQVDGEPNVRACTTVAREGMQVRSQNAWPSRDHDALAVNNYLDRMLPTGFYYKTFLWPRRLWPLYETILRHAAGLGEVDPDPDRYQPNYYDKQYTFADVTVVGGGVAGMQAALSAAQTEARVYLIDDQPELGGHLLAERQHLPGDNGAQQPGYELARSMARQVLAAPNIELLLGATAFGWYEDHMLGVEQDNRLIKLRTRQLVVATGAIEQPLLFQNNDLPGVFLASGAQRLLHLYGIRPGKRAAVITNNERGYRVALDLLAAGIEVAALADVRAEASADSPHSRELLRSGTPLLPGYGIAAAQGRQHVQGARLARWVEGTPVSGSEQAVSCDTIVLAMGCLPASGLLYQSGCKLHYDATMDMYLPGKYAEGVHAAGHVLGSDDPTLAMLEGEAAGLRAALQLSEFQDAELQSQLESLQRELEMHRSERRSDAHGAVTSSQISPDVSKRGKRFVCICEDVTVKDVKQSIAEGYDNIETLKRYSTLGMGPCQGKMCSLNSVKLCAQMTGRTVGETGATTARPPLQPVKLGVLAGRLLSPAKHASLHHMHLSLGARMMDAGGWQRPEHYGDPQAEVRAVRIRAGLIDVSTLGKLEVQGPDALTLLERIYTNKFARLGVGRVRYGVICDDAGIVVDDGVIARLTEDHFFVTATSGGVDGVQQWMDWWLAGWRLQAHVTNVTSDYAAVNLAGPLARDILQPLTALDLSNDAFPYLHFRDDAIAGIPARLLRIGFVGELGYEIHVPATLGEVLWEVLMEAGRERGLQPFGVEAQRILRLEKKHIIVGQDTDALSNPIEADMPWIVKLDKPDFIGKYSLSAAAERGPQSQLVGFMIGNGRWVPGEGEQILKDGHIVGRVTSARYSPTLHQTIGLAWLPTDLAAEGAIIQIRANGSIHPATVVHKPFYDPDGERLRM